MLCYAMSSRFSRKGHGIGTAKEKLAIHERYSYIKAVEHTVSAATSVSSDGMSNLQTPDPRLQG